MDFGKKNKKDLEANLKKLIEEIIKRSNGKHFFNNYAGIEIKLKRNLKEMTLAEVAEDICSISYLCKIEQNQIKPNLICLNDICKKLDIKDDALEALLRMDTLLENMVLAYYLKDKQKLEKIYNDGKGLENYRYKIIKFIYYISIFDYENADLLTMDIISLVSVLNDYDLLAFSVFYDILYFNALNPKDIYYELNIIEKLIHDDNALKFIIDELRLKALYKMNSPLVIKKGDELINKYLNSARFDLIDDVRYLESLFYLFNSDFLGYEKTKKLIKTKSLIKNLDLYNKVLNSEKIYIKDLKDTTDFAYCVGLAKIDGAKALELFNQKNFYNMSVEYDDTLIEYLTLEDIQSKYNFISFIVLPYIKASKNKMIGKYYEKELLKITKETNKYKLFYEFFMEMNSEL